MRADIPDNERRGGGTVRGRGWGVGVGEEGVGGGGGWGFILSASQLHSLRCF
jgi:hypothetical protein